MELKEVFEPIIHFLKTFQKKDKDSSVSKDKAKERLQLVLMQDRASVSPDFFEMMKKEIIEVIKKYIEIDEEQLEVQLTRGFEGDDGTGPALYANIPIKNIKPVAKKITSDETKTEKEKAKEIADNIIEDIKEVAEKTEKNIEETKEEVVDTIEKVEETAEETVQKTEEVLDETKENVENIVETTEENIQEIVEENVEENTEEVKTKAQANLDNFKDKINTIKKGAKEKISKAKTSAKDGISKIKSKVKAKNQ
jgi:cell division topological specificity factor